MRESIKISPKEMGAPRDARPIDDYLHKAIEISRAQKALALELRAACTRARRLEGLGSQGEVLVLLRRPA